MSAVALVTVFVWWAWRTFLFKYHQFVHYSNNYSSVYSKSQAAVSSVRRKGGNCNQELICCVIAHYHTVLAGLEDCQAWGLWPIRGSKPGPLDGCAKYGKCRDVFFKIIPDVVLPGIIQHCSHCHKSRQGCWQHKNDFTAIKNTCISQLKCYCWYCVTVSHQKTKGNIHVS